MLNHLMNTRALTLAVFAIATAMLTTVVSVPAGAKDKLLSQKELKNLIAKAETKAEHERIAQHFEAEAARWEAEADTHGELAQYYRRNPDPAAWRYSRSPRSSEHCDSLSKDLRLAAQESRQLAADHRDMAKPK